MGTRSIAQVERLSGVSRNTISRVLNSTGQYVVVERAIVEALSIALGVEYRYLAYGTTHEHPVNGMDMPSLIMERSRLLRRVTELERRPARLSVQPASPLMRWADEQKLEIRWTPEGKCQVLHDHEYVLAEGDDMMTTLTLARGTGT
jgi:transcriptional regulator with XRE-family HTH domain